MSPRSSLLSPSRNPYVDVLRGFSILVVVFGHFSATCGPFTAPWVVPIEFIRDLGRNNVFGVTIFFVVSGYLITTTSIQRFGRLGDMKLRDFYVYRASRILPVLLLLTALNLLCLYAGAADFALNRDVPLGRLLAYLFTFRFNVLYLNGGAVLAAWAVLWSLAIEEVFYLGYPLLCRALRRDGLIVAALVAFIVLGPIVRHRDGWSGLYSYTGCFDQLAFGCLAGLAARRLQSTPWFERAATASLAFGAVIVFTLYFARDARADAYWVVAPSGIAVGVALFLIGSSTWKPSFSRMPWWLRAPTLRLMGVLSYELYLFHMPLYLLLKHVSADVRTHTAGTLPRDVAFAVVLPLLLALGVVLAKYFGQPTQRWVRGWLTPSRAAAVGATVTSD